MTETSLNISCTSLYSLHCCPLPCLFTFDITVPDSVPQQFISTLVLPKMGTVDIKTDHKDTQFAKLTFRLKWISIPFSLFDRGLSHLWWRSQDPFTVLKTTCFPFPSLSMHHIFLMHSLVKEKVEYFQIIKGLYTRINQHLDICTPVISLGVSISIFMKNIILISKVAVEVWVSTRRIAVLSP